MDALSIMKTLENSSPIHRINRVSAVWGRCALAALMPLAVMNTALAQSRVSDADLEIASPAAGTRLDIKNFVFEDNILVDQAALSRALAPWSGRDLNAADLEKATAAAAEHLRTQGHTGVNVSTSRERGTWRVRVTGLKPTAAAYAAVQAAQPVVDIKGIVVEGATQVSAADLQAAVNPWVGKALTVAQLQEPARAVTDLLKARGFSLAQAFVPAQNLQNGQLRVQVVEGLVDASVGVSGVVVKGVQRTDTAVVANIIAPGAVAGQPLRAADLESRLMLANELPGLSLQASLVPGTKFGTTAVEVTAQEEKARSINLYADNHGSRFTGQARVGADLDIFSPSRKGDLISLGGVKTQDSGSFKMAWSVPVAFRDMRVGASLSSSQSNMNPQNVNVRFDGKANQSSLFAQMPLLRRADASVTSQASINNKKLSNNFEGMLFDKRDINSLSVGLSGMYLSDDRQGQTRWSSNLTTGDVNLLEREQSLNPRLDTQGRFTKLSGDYRMGRPLAAAGEASKWMWNTRASAQMHLNGANLDNSEKFWLGGPDGVRGYPVGEGSGDSGYLVSMEFSRPFAMERVHASRFFFFVDTGSVRRNPNAAQAAEASDGIRNQYSLHSAGIGLKLDFTPTTLVQLTLASPWGNNPAQVNGLNSDGRGLSQSRVWLSLNSRY